MGGRSGSGSGSGGSAAARAVRAILSSGGILAGANYNRDPGSMKGSDKILAAAYSGATPSQVRAIATGRRDVMANPHSRATRIAPIRVTVQTDRSGKDHIGLTDGRHRAIAAKRAGATHIRAEISTARQTAKGWVDGSTFTRVVKL